MTEWRDQETETQHALRAWLEGVRTGTPPRREAAAELTRLGVWSRGSVRTRGALRRPAPERLPEPERLEQMVSWLGDPDPEVRGLVALALGEWGGAQAARRLADLAGSDEDEDVRLHALAALRLIGGPVAVEALREAVESGSDTLRDAALAGIEELATGGRRDETEWADGAVAAPLEEADAAATSRPPVVSGAVRTHGAVRTRGASAGRGLVETLEGVRRDSSTPEYFRHRAEEVLRHLEGETGP
jgi:HEAT repeat protein